MVEVGVLTSERESESALSRFDCRGRLRHCNQLWTTRPRPGCRRKPDHWQPTTKFQVNTIRTKQARQRAKGIGGTPSEGRASYHVGPLLGAGVSPYFVGRKQIRFIKCAQQHATHCFCRIVHRQEEFTSIRLAVVSAPQPVQLTKAVNVTPFAHDDRRIIGPETRSRRPD